MEYNYYNYETPYNDTLYDNKFESITNVSQLPNYYIKQPNLNEFIIKCNNLFWGIFAFFLGSSGFLSLFICVIIFDIGQYSSGGIKIGIGFSGFLSFIGLISFLCFTIRQKVILTDDYIQIKNYHILCCINSNKKYNYIDIKGFKVNIVKENQEGREVTKNIEIICYDNSNEEKYFFAHNFELEEAEYFVYVVNGFIKTTKK